MDPIRKKCKKYRDQISINLYYLHRAHNHLSGIKLINAIRLLTKQNKQLYKKIRMIKCKGRDEILLTMEPLQSDSDSDSD